MNRKPNAELGKLIGTLGILLLAAAWFARAGCEREAKADPALPDALDRLWERLSEPGVPKWKQDLLPDLLARRIGKFEANVTCYCPFSRKTGQGCYRDAEGNWQPYDPPAGGLFAHNGDRLRFGHCAVDEDTIPLGSVLLIDGLDQLLLAVDTGSAIRGNDVDVCTPDPAHYYALARKFSHTKARCWIIRRGP